MTTSAEDVRKMRAEDARLAAAVVGKMVHDKQLAYGDAGGMQRGLWNVLLEPYREGERYVVPVELLDHLPRLTRVFDRVCRLVANPAADLGGEDPWRDMAGDALVGMVMPRTRPERKVPAPPDPMDARPGWGDDPHEEEV